MNIPIAKTEFTEREIVNILKPLRSGWVVQGPFVKEFEDKWCTFTGAENSIAVSNCTTALHLSLASLGIGTGDEVIVPAFTWIATANAVEYLGAKPVFCDIKLDTFNIDTSKIEECITKKTKAIVPVHLFGLSADMDEIEKLSSIYNLKIVEDAACGFGARYKGLHVGNSGETGCFSFHPRKAITTGEGGMITTKDGELALRLRAMRDHGASISDHQRHFGNKPYLLSDFPYLGYNYRMTDIQASIGSAQMDRANDIHIQRSAIADKYDEALKGLNWLRTPLHNADYEHGFQAYVSLFSPVDIVNRNNVLNINSRRNSFMDHLQQKGISTRPGTHAVHMTKYYANKYKIAPEDYLNAYIADHCSIAFPLFPSLRSEEFKFIVNEITNYTL
ncbi:MAG: DegT/DnrJ/EryC1/StrS family aminotransferase [Ignavibacteria bacterium]|nr:DegT/DnrJ/EryC1/StrS family aminotransferase [Ignavibacteria bacterium]